MAENGQQHFCRQRVQPSLHATPRHLLLPPQQCPQSTQHPQDKEQLQTSQTTSSVLVLGLFSNRRKNNRTSEAHHSKLSLLSSMLRRKPFRLVLSDTLGELEQELADTQAERPAERSERSIGSDSS